MGMAVVAGLSLAMSAVGGFLQYQASSSAAEMQARAAQMEHDEAVRTARDNYYRTTDELNRQQEKADTASREQMSDLARKMEAEQASMRVQLGEIGALGTISGERLEQDQSAVYGTNLARIEGNRRETIDAIQQEKTNAGVDRANANNRAGLQLAIQRADASIQKTKAMVSGIGGFLNSGVSIMNNYQSNSIKLKAAA
jgi:multidrug efflux pump subunit AcrB